MSSKVLIHRLSDVQRAATRLDLGQAVTAGAGSGKSTTLVVRYLLALRASQFDVHRVLAVTFTNKAAAELQRRIRHNVLLLARGEARLDESIPTSPDSDRAAWLRVADLLPESWITTLHGFCQRWLRQGTPDKELGANFQIIGDEGVGHPAREVVETYLDRLVMSPARGALSADLKSWLEYEPLTNLADRLESLLRKRHLASPWARSLESRTAVDVERLADSLKTSVDTQNRRERKRAESRWRLQVSNDSACRMQMAAQLDCVTAFSEIKFSRASRSKVVIESITALRHVLMNLNFTADDLETAMSLRRSVLDEGKPAPTAALKDGPWKARFRELLAVSEKVLGAWTDDGGIAKLKVHHDLGLEKALARLYLHCVPELEQRMRAENRIDFEGLIDHALSRLESRSEASPTFEHVLVDEFQDTDPRQWRLVNALSPNLDGVCIVGDDKQSIYRFREGDVETFRLATGIIRDKSRDGAAVVELNENYRSTAALVGFSNQLSREIFPDPDRDETAEPFESASSPMVSRRTDGISVHSHIEVRVLGGIHREAARRAEMSHVAELIETEILDRWQVHDGNGGVRPAKANDVAVLMAKRTGLESLETALARRALKFRTISGTGFYGRPEVKECCALLAWVADVEDSAATLGLVRSLMVGLSDTILAKACAARSKGSLWKKLTRCARDATTLLTVEERSSLEEALALLDRWRNLSGVLPASALLDVVIRESSLRFSLGQLDPSGRSEANVDQLIRVVQSREDEGDASFATLAREFRALIEEDTKTSQADPPSEEHAITIMTTHGSKGLEFPIVILVGLGDTVTVSGPSLDPIRFRVSADEVQLVVPLKSRDSKQACKLSSLAASVEKAKGRAESARLLYVAVTRAQDHLVLVGSDAGQKRAKGALASVLSALNAQLDVPEVEVPILDMEGALVLVRKCEGATELDGHARKDLRGILESIEIGVGEARPRLEFMYRVPLRPTAFATAMGCPRKFFLEQGLGAPASKAYLGHNVSADSTHARSLSPTMRGNAIHAAFEALAAGRLPSEDVDWACQSAGIFERRHVEDIRALVMRAETGFLAWDLGQKIRNALLGEVRSELTVSLDIEGLPVMGTMDLLYAPAGDGPAYVIDFKSDVARDLGEARTSIEKKGYRSQVALYCVAARRILGRPVEGYLFFTALGSEVHVVGASELEAAESSLRVLSGAARAGFPKTSDPQLCLSCEHLSAGRCGGALG